MKQIMKMLLKYTGIKAVQLVSLMAFSVSVFASEINTNWRDIAVDGYDVVAYFEQNAAVEGESKLTYEWKDAKWRFSSIANLEKFKQAPEAYAPQYGGYCAYAISKGYTASIDPEAWSIVDGKLYLNYDLSVRKLWLQDSAGYITKAEQNWPTVKAGL